MSVIWQSLRNRRGNLKTYIFKGHSDTEYAFRFMSVFRLNSAIITLRRFFSEYFLIYKFVIIPTAELSDRKIGLLPPPPPPPPLHQYTYPDMPLVLSVEFSSLVLTAAL